MGSSGASSKLNRMMEMSFAGIGSVARDETVSEMDWRDTLYEKRPIEERFSDLQ